MTARLKSRPPEKPPSIHTIYRCACRLCRLCSTFINPYHHSSTYLSHIPSTSIPRHPFIYRASVSAPTPSSHRAYTRLLNHLSCRSRPPLRSLIFISAIDSRARRAPESDTVISSNPSSYHTHAGLPRLHLTPVRPEVSLQSGDVVVSPRTVTL